MSKNTLKSIYASRPFKTRNADEYEIESILDLFIDPTDGLTGPFDYDNTIVKGKMGSGKTMYLRANLAYYLYDLIPCIMENDPIILPIYIKLSDFQNIKDSETIYSSIIVRIIEEMANVCVHLTSSETLAKLHKGFIALPYGILERQSDIDRVKEKLNKITADEYVERMTNEFSTAGKMGNEFINACTSFSKGLITEIKKKGNPSFDNICDAYEILLKPFNGKLLILFDEVGSINKSFFKEDNCDSVFEILMNQLRTLDFVRTKIAIYPHSFADILTETRYGDIVELEDDIVENKFDIYLNRTISLIERYLEKAINKKCCIENIFDIDNENVNLIEQLINASNGNMRRLVHLLDMTMNASFKRCNCKEKINIIDVNTALCEQAQQMEVLFTTSEKELLSDLVSVCKARNAYKFSFPNRSVSLTKYANKSSEYNIIKVLETGSGRKGSIYEFDYAYCVYRDIPTHYIKNTDRLDKTRSRITGERIKRVTKITESLIEQAVLPGKIDGQIIYLNREGSSGVVKSNDNKEYILTSDFIIKDDRNKKLTSGKKIRFIPVKVAELDCAIEIELL